jgi:hypothetical protein
MESNEIIRGQIFEIIKNQIKSESPPETKKTFEKLKKLGYSDGDAEKLIGQCVAVELFDVLKNKKPFNETRYVSNMEKLPGKPFGL